MKLQLVLSIVLSMSGQLHSDRIVKYDRTGQGLTSFPHDIPQDVDQILLGSNHISRIDYIEPLTDLDALTIPDNGLTEFPDCKNISKSLLKLSLENNKITVIPTERIRILIHLTSLSIYNNPLVSLPNFGVMPSPPSLSVTLINDKFACDWRMALVKHAMDAGKVVFLFHKPMCNVPRNLAGRSLEDISVQDLIYSSNGK